jgi:hypothetical protein
LVFSACIGFAQEDPGSAMSILHGEQKISRLMSAGGRWRQDNDRPQQET